MHHHTAVAPLPRTAGDPTLALRDQLVSSLGRTAPPPSTFVRPAEDSYTCLDQPLADPASPSDMPVHVCLHWNSADYATAPGAQDVPAASTWLGTVARVIDHVASTYVEAGYHGPKPDSGTEKNTSGQYDPVDSDPNLARRQYTDIYLADTGAQHEYGYCSVDAIQGATGTQLVNPPSGNRGDVPAFCVLDDDFSAGQFGGRSTPLAALEVTVAHEFFHAVQFSYDFFEDHWFMESTAVWAEKALYPDINDNLQYLPYSQLRTPGTSMDDDQGNGGFLHYGDWIFIRYLTEHIPAMTGPLPNLVLQMWQNSDTTTGPGMYSIQAIANAVQSRGYDFNRVFAQYADALHHPANSWTEGAANGYPTAPVGGHVTLRPNRRGASGSVRIDHLASATVKVIPQRLASRRFKLRVGVQMGPRRIGSAAVVSVFYRNGTIATRTLRLSPNGSGQAIASFSSRKVRFVELTLANASRRYHCWTRTPYSCSGTPLDDSHTERFSFSVLR